MRSVFRTVLLAFPLTCPLTLPPIGAAQQAVTAPQAAASQQPTALVQQQLEALKGRFQDFAQLNRYGAENEALGEPAAGVQRVVFYGDSITDNWGRKFGSFFPGKPYVNRGISGQTTPQMLIRFQQDVVHLHPAAVVILAGTNDIAQNTGPEPMSAIEDNFRSMVAIAKAAHIRVVLASVLPADRYPWHPGIAPAAQIRELNAWLARFAKAQHLVYLDYYLALATPAGAMRPELAEDKAVHPNDAGYAIMQPLAERAIAASLALRAP
jgi:lysophospholipase L1-like esterase